MRYLGKVIESGVLVLACTLAGSAPIEHLRERSEMQKSDTPFVRIRPGMPVTELVRGSSAPIDLAHGNDDATLTIEDQPIVVEYVDTDKPVRFPATLLLVMRQYAGVVTHFGFAPQSSYLNLPKSYELATRQADALTNAGWRPDEMTTMDYAAMEQRFKGRGADVRFGANFGTWRRGAVEVNLYLEEAPHVKGPPPPPEFAALLLNLSFSDDALEDKASKMVYAERKKVNGSENIPLPLTYWLNK